MKFDLKLNELTKILEAHAVEYCYVFGSVAFGDNNEKSDLDLLIKYSTEEVYQAVREKLQALYAPVVVDLMTDKALSTPLFNKTFQMNKIKIYPAL